MIYVYGTMGVAKRFPSFIHNLRFSRCNLRFRAHRSSINLKNRSLRNLRRGRVLVKGRFSPDNSKVLTQNKSSICDGSFVLQQSPRTRLVPAPNVYSLPVAIGFAGHTPTKRRMPAVTIGRKCSCDPVHGHGHLYDLRDQTRFGKLHQPKYRLGAQWKPTPSEGNPAPNIYHPNLNAVRPNAPGVSFKSRTRFGRVESSSPSPNTYTLQSTIKKLTKPDGSLEPRFPCKSEGDPAPNAYHVPPVDAYKYRRMAGPTMTPWRPPVKGDFPPPPNAYYPKVATNGPAATFGQKSSRKRCIF